MKTITLAGGCFWCTEGIFKRLRGVTNVVSGYANSNKENPSYLDVCSGQTGAAEAIQITFDPTILSLDTIFDVFWHLHNPTTKNQQGADVGTEYRSAIFYQTPEQQQAAEQSKQVTESHGMYKDPIVTEIVPLRNFYPAEDYHQNYYDKNGSAPYCSLVVDPKIQKLLQEFGDKVKDEYKH